MSAPEGPPERERVPEREGLPTPEGAAEREGPPATEGPPARRPRFVRTRRGRLIGGVCSGLGEHFGVDPLLLRIAFVGLTFFGGAGLWLYLAIVLFTPEEGATRAPIRLLASSWQILAGAVVLIAALAVLVRVISGTLLAGNWGFAAAVGFIALAGIVAATIWRRLRGRRGSADVRLLSNLSLLAAVAAALILLAVAGGALAGTERHAAAWVVLALGLALLASAFTPARWLVLGVGAFVLPVVVFAAANVNLNGGVGRHIYRLHSLSQIRRSYELGAGQLEVDLRDVTFPPGTTPLHVRLGVGELVVLVPDDVCVRTRAHLGGGFVGALEEGFGGLDLKWRNRVTPVAGARVLMLEGTVGLGALFVLDRPLSGRFQAGEYGSDEACTHTAGAPA